MGHEKFYQQLGRNIASLRKSRGLSQSKFAELSGISRSYLSKIEADGLSKKCSLDVLLDIADAFEVDIVDIIRNSENKDA